MNNNTITPVTFANEQEYNEAKMMHDANDQATRNWMKENKTNGIPSEVYTKFPYADKVDNDLRSKLEVWEFLHDIPDRYFLYISEDKHLATTWTGSPLGKVGFGNKWTSCFGDVRVAINVYAINGKTYHGVYYKSSGGYARIKLFKHQ